MPDKNGLHLITPTSVSASGGSATASIGANGTVTFNCNTLTVNGIFSSDYDTYMIAYHGKSSTTGSGLYIRFTQSGTPDATASSYTSQLLQVVHNVQTVTRYSSALGYYLNNGDDYGTGSIAHIYSPFISGKSTSWRTVNSGENNSSASEIIEYAGTHNLGVSSDGIFLFCAGSTTRYGALSVYGMRN